MKRFLLFFVCTIVIAAEPAKKQVAAEITIEGALLNHFAFTEQKNRPIQPGVASSVQASVYPTILDSNNTARTRLHISISGNLQKSETQSVLRGRRSVTATVYADVQGRYIQDIDATSSGVSPAQPVGHTQINASVSTSNNFRLLNGLVQRKADAMASGMLSSQLPGVRMEANQKVAGEIRGAAEQASQSVANLINEASKVIPARLPEKTSLQFSSRSGPYGGSIKMEVVDKRNIAREPQPVLDFKDQAIVKSVVSEDLLSETLSSQIVKGKQMKLMDLHTKLCGTRTARFIDFCSKELNSQARQSSILFDSEKPVEIKFRDDKITVRLNAVFNQHAGLQMGGGDLFQKPDKDDVAFGTVPYTVEATYQIGEKGAKLASLTVGENTALVKGKEDHTKPGAQLGRVASGLLGSRIKSELVANFKSVFKEEIVTAPSSFPTKIVSGDTFQPVVQEASSLVPLEMKAQRGWLSVSMAYCSDAMRPFGATLFDSPEGLQISEVQGYSPAWNNYFAAGDIIKTFGVPGREEFDVPKDSKPFYEFLRKRAAGDTPTARTIEIKGIAGSTGDSFTRRLALCPSKLDHREGANATLRAVLGN